MPNENIIEFECGNCHEKMRVHKPHLVRVDNGIMTQVTLIPSWSTEERVCRNCHHVCAPRILDTFQFGWVTYKPAVESNVVKPTAREVANLAGHKRAMG